MRSGNNPDGNLCGRGRERNHWSLYIIHVCEDARGIVFYTLRWIFHDCLNSFMFCYTIIATNTESAREFFFVPICLIFTVVIWKQKKKVVELDTEFMIWVTELKEVHLFLSEDRAISLNFSVFLFILPLYRWRHWESTAIRFDSDRTGCFTYTYFSCVLSHSRRWCVWPGTYGKPTVRERQIWRNVSV